MTLRIIDLMMMGLMAMGLIVGFGAVAMATDTLHHPVVDGLLRWAMSLVVACILAALLAMVVVNWLVGCESWDREFGADACVTVYTPIGVQR